MKNYIIAEINIKENNQNERIINSYEEANRNGELFEYKMNIKMKKK